MVQHGDFVEVEDGVEFVRDGYDGAVGEVGGYEGLDEGGGGGVEALVRMGGPGLVLGGTWGAVVMGGDFAKGLKEEKGSKTNLLITSSRSSTFPFLRTALARLNSCFCPCDRFSSSISASSPPLPSMTFHSSTFCSASTISSSVTEVVGSAFRRTPPSKMYGSCGTATREERTCSWGMVERGILSMVMEPWEIGRRRRRVERREDLPL